MRKENLITVCNASLRCISAHWKKLFAAAACAVILAGAGAGAHYFFYEIEGTVTKIDGSKIAVTDFLTTRVVDFTDSPVDLTRVKPGDEVEIKRNLTGTVYALKIERHAYGNHDW